MLDKKEIFNDVKIIPAITAYILINFVVIFISLFIDYNIFNKNFELLQLIIDILFFIFLLHSFDVRIYKLLDLIKDFILKFNIKEIVCVVFTQLCLSTGTTFLILGVLCLVSVDTANSLLNEPSQVINNTIFSFIVTVIGAPLIEELLFRSICFKRLSKIFNVYIGMIISSVFFGILHLELAILGAIVFAIANCILYLKYKNILIPISVHFFNNLIATLPSIFSSSTSKSKVEILNSGDGFSYIIIGLIGFLIGLILFIIFIIKNREYIYEDAFDDNTYKFSKNLLD